MVGAVYALRFVGDSKIYMARLLRTQTWLYSPVYVFKAHTGRKKMFDLLEESDTITDIINFIDKHRVGAMWDKTEKDTKLRNNIGH